jgi:hypothetical integral membrane protein (TIGR02206 family)
VSLTRPFRLFGPDHLAVLLLILGAGYLLVRFARRGDRRRNTILGRLLAGTLVAYGGTVYFRIGMAGQFSVDYALPLELCHWVLIACVVALVAGSRLASEISYFWGTAGTLASALTPDITDGFPSWEFVLFYWSHGGILLAIAFLIGRGFRATRGSVLRVVVALNAYAAVVGTLDWWFGWNYGYLRHKPAQPSLLDFLGPWPWYLVSLELIALVSFWVLARVLREGRDDGDAEEFCQ